MPRTLTPFEAAYESWSQRVGGFATTPALVRQLGADPKAVLSAANLGPHALDEPEGRIPYAALGRLLHEAASRTGCAHFGLLCGRAWHLTDLGLLGEIASNAPTVGD